MVHSNFPSMRRFVFAMITLGVLSSCARNTNPREANTKANEAIQKQFREKQERLQKENLKSQQEKTRQQELVRKNNLKEQAARDKAMKANQADDKPFPRTEKIPEPKKEEDPNPENNDPRGTFQ